MNAVKIKIEKQLFDELNKNIDIILIPQRILDQIENKNKMGINSLSLQEIISIHPSYKFHQGYRPINLSIYEHLEERDYLYPFGIAYKKSLEITQIINLLNNDEVEVKVSNAK